MSAAAAAEMRAVLQQLSALNNRVEAREEAGMKLRNNRARVLKDVCNPSPDTNIDGKPLTQLELVRVAPEHERFADEASPRDRATALGAGPDAATHKRGSAGVGGSGDVSGRSHSGDASRSQAASQT